MIETEIKFRIDDPERIASALRKAGAKKADSGFEKNIIYDRGGELAQSERLLRLRSYSGKADITFKRKIPAEKFKVREELRVRIESFEKGASLLEALGFRPVWKYEKKRQTWELDGAGVTIDLMPMMGNFVEIEGSEKGIAEAAEKLGLDMTRGITKSYGDLFREYCKDMGIQLKDMVFGDKG